MHQLLVTYGFDLHKYPVGLGTALVLADGKRLATFGRALVNNIKLVGGMLTEKIAENKFRLRLAVRLHFIVYGHVYRLVQVFGKFFGTTGLNSFFHLADDIALGKSRKHLQTNQHQD